MSTLRKCNYKAVAELERQYHGRKFTPDGHLVGSIGEVVAAKALGLTLYPGSHPGHDAYDANGDVQIKMTSGASVSLYATCTRLVVLKVVNPEEAEIVYDGPGEPALKLLMPVRQALTGILQKSRLLMAMVPATNDPRSRVFIVILLTR
jgi:hypothetical protein